MMTNYVMHNIMLVNWPWTMPNGILVLNLLQWSWWQSVQCIVGFFLSSELRVTIHRGSAALNAATCPTSPRPEIAFGRNETRNSLILPRRLLFLNKACLFHPFCNFFCFCFNKVFAPRKLDNLIAVKYTASHAVYAANEYVPVTSDVT